MKKYQALKEHLESRFPNLHKSEMVRNPAKNSGYENDLRSILGMNEPPQELKRICDAIWSQLADPIEFKKGNIWFDAIRIAEQALTQPFREVIWIHFGISKSAKRINRITCFKLSNFIKLIGLNNSVQAEAILASYRYARSRGCNNNNQWSVTPDKLEDIAEFVIRHSNYSQRTDISGNSYDFVPRKTKWLIPN